MTATKVAWEYVRAGILAIELTAGAIDTDAIKSLRLLSKEASIILHNYYPPASSPIVLNIASGDKNKIKETLEFIKKSIQISHDLEIETYGIHAGMKIDLAPSDLGGKITSQLTDVDFSFVNFINNFRNLSEYAKKLGVKLLIENHALNRETLENFGNILCLTTASEVSEFFSELELNSHLLLDVGHLNVTSKSLGLEREAELAKLEPFAGGYQLSANSGFQDDHACFDKSAWFLKLINLKLDYITLEIGNNNLNEIIQNYTWFTEFLEAQNV
jgi:sugar phosphate isomerase/epimerase